MDDDQMDVAAKPTQDDDPGKQASLSEEEQEYERMFANRYTEDDPEYAKTKNLPDPPCIYPWFGRPKRVFDFARFGNRREEQGSNRRDDRDSWRHRRDSPSGNGDRDRSNQRRGDRDRGDDRRPYERDYSRNDRRGDHRDQWHNRPRNNEERGVRDDKNGDRPWKRPADNGDRTDDHAKRGRNDDPAKRSRDEHAKQ